MIIFGVFCLAVIMPACAWLSIKAISRYSDKIREEI